MADVGIDFQTTAITFSSGFLAEILSMDGPNFSREVIPTNTTTTTGAITKQPANNWDPGEIEVEIAFDPNTDIPIQAAREAVTLTMPSSSTGGTDAYAFNGFLSGFQITGSIGERMTARATLTLSGFTSGFTAT